MPGIKLKIELLTKVGFFDSFNKLCNDPLTVKDKYALSRTRREILSHSDTFREEYAALVNRHGEPEVDVLQRRLDAIPIIDGVTNGQRTRIQQRIVAWQSGVQKPFAVDDQNPEKWAAFNADLRKLAAIEFEVFLDHKIQLPENTNLTAVDMDVLSDLIAEP